MSGAVAPVDIRFQRQIILPVAAALFLLVTAFLTATSYYLDQREAFETQQIARHAYQIRDELIERKSVEIAFLARRMAALYAPHAQAMRARDRVRLGAVGRTFFAELQRDFNITNVYFIGTDKRVVLRLHRPEEHGDEVKRDTLAYAALAGEPVTGVEVDKLAIPTLRHVLPWVENGERIGYIEVGTEVDSLIRSICGILGVDIVSVVHKEYSQSDSFAAGKARYGFIGNWDDYDNLALLHSSLPAIPATLMSQWQKGTADVFEVGGGNKVWSASLLPLEDIGGRQSISLALLRDVSAARQATRQALVAGMILVSLLAILLWLSLRWRTGKIEAHVIAVYEQIRESERELRVASEKAQAANIAKSQFLSTMRHELRTPLNGILGMAQLLEMEGTTEAERKEFVKSLNESGQNLLTLVNDILDLSQIEAGELELKDTHFDPVDLLQESASLFRANAEQKGLTLDATWLGPEQYGLVGDAARLRQMLSCLVGNAIKFSERGAIRMEGRVVEGSLPLIEFSVSDQGIGIAEEAKPRLFEAFSQVDGSGTRRYGGAGLGLSIVRRLAEKMGGEVGVESKIGEGSRFWFRVRLARLENYPLPV